MQDGVHKLGVAAARFRALGAFSVAIVCLLAAATHAAAARVEEVFNSLYGDDIAAVRATPEKQDDVAMAGTLLKAVGSTDQHDLRKLILQEAYELGIAHPDGYETAAQALETLSRISRSKGPWAREKMALLRQQQYALARGADRAKAGDALIEAILACAADKEDTGQVADALELCETAATTARAVGSTLKDRIDRLVDRLQWRQRVAGQIEMYKRRLAANEWDQDAREASILLHAAECNNPAEAAKLLTRTSDADQRLYLPLAAKGIDSLDEQGAIGLGDFYRELVRQASRHAKPALLAKAGECYTRFLKLHTTKDLEHTKATMALKKVAEELDELRRQEAAATVQTAPGLLMSAYSTRYLRQLPDFGQLRPFSTQVVRQINHFVGRPQSGETLPDVPRGSCLAVVFSGYITVLAEGDYTFYCESDDGSRLYVDQTRVVDNDGTHGMREQSGKIRLSAGRHVLRVEYFNYSPPGGVIARYEGPATPKQVIPPEVLSHQPVTSK